MEDHEEHIILKPSSDPSVLGFRKIRDRYRYTPRISIGVFVLLFFLVIVYSLYKNKLHIPGFEVICLAGMFLSIISGWFIVRMNRRCPECKKKMRRLFPDENDNRTSYKYYCPKCMVYMDTDVTNSIGGD